MFWLIFLVTMGISLFAAARVKLMIARYSRVPVSSGMTGAETAAHILRVSGIRDVAIEEGNSLLGDHFDPVNHKLVLSPDIYNGSSAAAVGIAAHECGHALQRQTGYAPLNLRMAAVSATGFASQVVTILPLLFFFTHSAAIWHWGLVLLAAGWGTIMLFNLVTLPVEFNASARAKALLPALGIVRGESEEMAVRKVLDAAALTYVAAFVTSLAYFLMYLLPLLGGRNR